MTRPCCVSLESWPVTRWLMQTLLGSIGSKGDTVLDFCGKGDEDDKETISNLPAYFHTFAHCSHDCTSFKERLWQFGVNLTFSGFLLFTLNFGRPANLCHTCTWESLPGKRTRVAALSVKRLFAPNYWSHISLCTNMEHSETALRRFNNTPLP